MFLIRCKDKNLEYFQTSNVLFRRQGRWSETLLTCDFVIEHSEDTKNTALDDIVDPRPEARLLVTLTVDPYDDLMPAIITAQGLDCLLFTAQRS
jgi:hypothetical protein